MFFLFRVAFWLSLVILFLPAQENDTQAADISVSAGEALGVATSAISDMSAFCQRNPDTCETGGEALKTFSRKAQYGAKLIYDYLGGLNDEDGSRSVNTLTPEDMKPAWRGPDGKKA